jgi:hypothetical protein
LLERNGGDMSKALRFLQRMIANPVEATLFIPEYLSARHEYRPDYEPDLHWEARLHRWLGTAWPCPEQARLAVLWDEIATELRRRGLRFGRFTYGEYSDAESALARAVWCTVLHLRPPVVVETGVARGVTSRIVLEAMNRNHQGHLWSIDLPHPVERRLHQEIGAAVPASCHSRWTYIKGSSRRRLPSLLRSLAGHQGGVDLFIHDSLHTARNTRYEMERVLGAMASSGGFMVIDDIGTHQAFAEFARNHPSLETAVCQHSDSSERGAESCFGLVRVRQDR